MCSRVALVAAVAVEVLCKELLTRPALYDGSFHIAAVRLVVPERARAAHGDRRRRRRLAMAARAPLAVAWAIASIVLLQLAGWHTPTDLAGGVLLAALALLGARAPELFVVVVFRRRG